MVNGIFLVINLTKIIKKLLKFIFFNIIQINNISKVFRSLSILSLFIFVTLVLLALKFKFESELIETIIIVISLCGIFIFFHPIPETRYDSIKKIPYSNNYVDNDLCSEIVKIEFNGYNNWFFKKCFKNDINNKILVIVSSKSY